MTDTDRDFFRWTRDKQGAFSKNLKQELDKKLPIEGGTITGPLKIKYKTPTLATETMFNFEIGYQENTRTYNWGWEFIPYSPISYYTYNKVQLFGICHNLGLFPGSAGEKFTLGYYGARWPNVYANKLNNGGDIEIPEKAGTMALLSDIEDVLRKYNLIPQQEPEVPDDGTQE